MIHELRIYHCLPGRLPALLKRFETRTLKIWEKHGIRQAGFWTVIIGDSNLVLYYLLAWESLAEREAKWNAFVADPEWAAARTESGEGRPDPRQGHQRDPAADRFLVGQVAFRSISLIRSPISPSRVATVASGGRMPILAPMKSIFPAAASDALISASVISEPSAAWERPGADACGMWASTQAP